MWLFLIFIFFVFLGAWAVQDDAKVIFCEHDYEYDGDSFTSDDQHYGRYYICKKCGHEHFINYKDWRDMRDIYPKKFEYWKNRPFTKSLAKQLEHD